MNKKIDWAVVILMPIFVTIISLWLDLNFVVSTFLFFGMPAIYLVLRNKSILKRTVLFTILFSIPLTFIIEYLIAKDGAWYIVNTFFPFRLFDIVVIEEFLWAFLWVFYIVIFYKYFFDKKTRKSIFTFWRRTEGLVNKRMIYLSIALFTFLLVFVTIVIFIPEYVQLNYAYLLIGSVVAFIPLVTFLLVFPNFLSRFFGLAVYFCFHAVLVEYVGLKLGYWIFPATHVLGMVNFFGFSMPIEEFLVYFVFLNAAVIAYYEFFDDDLR
jgi:hypothetical protein